MRTSADIYYIGNNNPRRNDVDNLHYIWHDGSFEGYDNGKVYLACIPLIVSMDM